jgi:hypothetical protein
MEMLYPMFALVMLTFGVGIGLGTLRLLSVKRRHVDPRYYRLLAGYEAPEYVVKLGRNFSNLLEVPVLFYVLGVLVIVTGIESPPILALAWLYVGLRLVHSAIHITYNHPLHRFLVFLASSLVLIAMWVWVMLVVGGLG